MAASKGQNAARESLKNKGFSRSKQKYEIKTNDGQSLGKVSYGAYQAIRYNTLDRYTPKSDNEKKVIESYRNHTYGEGNYEIYQKYGINPTTFSFDDLYDLSPSLGYEAWTNSDKSPKKDTYSPAKGISKTQKKDFNTLYALAQNNQNSKDSKKDKGRFAAFQNNLKSGITFGAYDFFSDKVQKKAHEKGGMPEENRVTSKHAQSTTNAAHPIASEVGQEVGSTAIMLALSKGVGKATKALPWFGKLPQFAQHSINSGLTFATMSGAEKGFSGGDLKDIAKSVGIGGVGGTAGGVASYGVGKLGEKVIFSKGLQKLLSNRELQHKVVPEIIRSGAAGAAFAATDTATTYYLRPENERPDAQQIRKQILTGFAFGAITSGIEAINASDASRDYLDDLNTKMMSDYEKMARTTGASNENITGKKRLAENVIKYNEVMKAYLNNDSVSVDIDGKLYEFPESRARFLGQDKYVKAIKDNLDIVTTNAKSFLDGMPEGETAGGARTASVPDSIGPIPAATGAVSEATTRDGISAVRPNDTKLYAPARNGAAGFAADRAADRSVVTSVAKPVSVQSVSPEMVTRTEDNAANDIITANRTIDQGAPNAAQTTQNVQPVNVGNNINKPFTRQETSALVRGKHVMSYNTGGGSYIVNSNMALKVDNKNSGKIGEEYKKQTSFDVEPVDVGVGDIIQSVLTGNSVGAVDGYSVEGDGAKAVYVINNNGNNYSFAKAYADILQSRSASLGLVDSGTDLGVALAGYDNNGGIVGFTWGIKKEYSSIDVGLTNSVAQAVKDTLNYDLGDTQRLINMFQEQAGGDGMSGIADYLIAKGDVGDYGAFFTDGGAAVNSIIRNGVNNNVNDGVLQGRTYNVDGGVERGTGERSFEQSRAIRAATGGIEEVVGTGQEAAEISDNRQAFTGYLKRTGTLIERRITVANGEIVFFEIPPERLIGRADAQTIIEENRRNGINTNFFSGYATANSARFQGFAARDTVYIMYDNNKYTPEQINAHERTHIMAETSSYRTLRNSIIGGLSEQEQLELFINARDKYIDEAAAHVERLFKENPNMAVKEKTREFAAYIWEEIIADLNGGMGAMADYTERFAEDIARFKGEAATAAETENIRETSAESMANASPAEYAEEIDGGGVKYSFGGENARGADKTALVRAQAMEQSGSTPEDIWSETGWGKGADGEWRFEIDDNDLHINNIQYLKMRHAKSGSVRLGQLVRHDSLFEAYPQLPYMVVYFEDIGQSNGAYHRDGDYIQISNTNIKTEEDLKETLIHEIQHAIQNYEGFAHGSNPRYWQNRLDEKNVPLNEEYRKKAADARAELSKVMNNNPQLFMDVRDLMMSLPSVPRGEFDFETLEEITPDPPEWQEFDRRRDALEDKYGEIAVFDAMDLFGAEGEYRDRMNTKSAYDLYYNTAGEIEARDAADRGSLDADKRRERFPRSMKPDPDRVFAEDGGISYDIVTLDNGKQYIEASRQVIKGSDVKTMRQDVTAFFKEMLKNGSVDIVATNGDVLTISKETANKARDNYYYKNGKPIKLSDDEFNVKLNAEAHIDEIAEISRQKGRRKRDKKNHNFAKKGFTYRNAYFKDFDGKYYMITLSVGNNNGVATIYNVVPKKDNLPSGNIVSCRGSKAVGKLSLDNTIPRPNPFVKRFSSVDRTNQTTTSEFKNWFGDWENDPQNASKIVNEDGTPKVMYHGTDADFTVFDRTKGRSGMDIQGMFFSPWEIDAGGYGNNVGAYYLNIKNPASGEEAFKALNKFKGQNYAGIKAREYLEKQGYDGVNFYDEEFVAFYPTQIKSATGNIGTFDPANPDIRYSIENLDTQNLLQQIAEDIGYHEGLIEASKKNKTEVRELLNDNKRLKTSLENAKRQMVRTKIPRSNRTVVGKATREIIKSLSSKTNAQEIAPRVIEVYDTYFKEMHEAGCVEELEQKAAENMAMAFQDIAADIIAEGEEWTSDEDYKDLVTYLRSSRIKIPDNVKADIHYNEFRKAHFGTMTLANDGVPVDIIYQELCDIFPHLFSDKVANPADQIEEIASVVDGIRPRAYNPHEQNTENSLNFAVEQFMAIVDDVVEKKTKADKMYDKAQRDKAAALQKEREAFEKRYEKLRTEAKEKADRQRYINYWDKRLAVEDVKNQKDAVIANIREKRKVSILKAHIRKTANDLSSRLKNPKGAPAELVKSIADICSKLDFTTDRTGKNGGENKSNLRLLELKKTYDALKNDTDYDIASEYDEELSRSISKLDDVIGKKRIVDLDVQELTDLNTILKQINHAIINANKQIGKANALENKQLGIQVINELNEQKGFNRNIATRLMTLASSQVLNPMRMAEMMSGYKTGSILYGMFKDLNDGIRKQAKFKMDASKPFDELVSGKGNGKLHEKFVTELVDTGMKFEDGTSVKIPKSMMCELVMLWDRKQGRSHLEKGGFTVPDFKSYNKGKVREAFTTGQKTVSNVSEADIVRIRGMLDKYDKLWIERARAFFNGSAQKAVNEVSMLLKGRKVATAANYIPIHTDKNYVRTEIEGVKLDASIEGSGTLKGVVENAPQPVYLMGLPYTVAEHIDFVAKYARLAIPIRNFNKIYNVNTVSDSGARDSVKHAVGQKWGANIVKYGIDQLLTDLQTTRQTPKDPLSKLLGTVQSNWVAATLNANISVCIKQAASYPTAAYVVGMKPLAKALKARAGIKKADLQAEIDAHTGLHYLRRIGLSTQELGDRAGSNNLIKRVTDKIDSSLVDKGVSSGILPSNWIQSVDVATTETLWLAAKYYVEDDLNIPQNSSNYWDEVTQTFETIIEETQPNYDVMHRPEIQKTTNAMLRAMIMFQTQPLQNSGILYSSIGAIGAKNSEYKAAKEAYEQNRTSENKARLDEAKRQSDAARARCARASAALVTSAITFVAMTALARFALHNVKRYRDKDGEVSVKKVLMGALSDLEDQAVTTIFPVGGNIASELVSNTLNGYDYEIPTTQMLNNLRDAANGVGDVYKDLTGKGAYLPTIEKLKKLRDAANDLLKVTGELTGVPVTNAENIGVSIWKYIKDAINGELFSSDANEYKPKYVYGYADLAGAIVSGNDKKEAKIKEYFKDSGCEKEKKDGSREIDRAPLTRYLKPAYREYVGSDPQAARRIKKTLIRDYGYDEKTIDSWLEGNE